MRVPYRWLLEHVDVSIDPREAAERLTMAGVEAEVEPVSKGVSGVKVGRIVRVRRHPDADRLELCLVDLGDGRPVQFVSGAPNLVEGARVAAALPGATLPGGRRVDRAEFRGQESAGMLCSARELGLYEDRPEEEAGILILPDDAPLGEDAARVLSLDDETLVLAITPNRGDCQSVRGVARELSAITGAPMRPFGAEEETEGAGGPRELQGLIVEIVDEELCPRYSAALVDELEIGPSPLWMQARLRASGLRPINNLVDVTNYVMLELGQPLHAFDRDRVAQGRIVIRPARDGEKIVTLDGVERELEEGMLLIADPEKAIGVAGVMGGLNSEVTDRTSRTVIESAHFSAASVGRTARRLGLRSEAAVRFEKGVDPAGTVRALRRAIHLLESMGAGHGSPAVVDLRPRPIHPARVLLRPERANSLLGLDLGTQEMCDLLRRLGMETSPVDDGVEVTVPTRRPDVTMEADLIEEIGRLYGYDRIDATMPRGTLTRGSLPPREEGAAEAARALCLCGLSEVVTYSFADPDAWDRLGLPEAHPWRSMVRLANPLRREHSALRTTLVPGLLEVLRYNASRGVEDLCVFEVGTVYVPRSLPVTGLPDERLSAGVAAMGRCEEPHWSGGAHRTDFYWLKGVLEEFADAMGCTGVSFSGARRPLLHPSRAAEMLIGGEVVGFLGELGPAAAERYALEQRALVAELDLERILEIRGGPARYTPVPRFPSSRRDISMILLLDVPAERVERVLREAGGELLEEARLFDVYSGDPVPDGHRSLAYSLIYRAPDRTLTDREVDAAHDGVRSALEESLGARLRS